MIGEDDQKRVNVRQLKFLKEIWSMFQTQPDIIIF
jgi:hypothetical protein